jgi:hypothetical protein
VPFGITLELKPATIQIPVEAEHEIDLPEDVAAGPASTLKPVTEALGEKENVHWTA